VDNAYGIYLSQMLFLVGLTWAGWGTLSATVPWPVLCLAAVVIVFASGMALTSVLAKTPLAMPFTGRAQVAWRPPRSPQPATMHAGATDEPVLAGLARRQGSGE
jgi:hypothetical protein